MTSTTTPVRQSAGYGRSARRRGRVRGKRWQGDAVARLVHEALASRDLDDPESVTEATAALRAGVETLLDRPLGDYEVGRLRRLAATKRPSMIIRFLHRLNGGITDPVARSLATRSNISDLIWG